MVSKMKLNVSPVPTVVTIQTSETTIIFSGQVSGHIQFILPELPKTVEWHWILKQKQQKEHYIVMLVPRTKSHPQVKGVKAAL